MLFLTVIINLKLTDNFSSDSAAMASGPPDGMANQEPAEVQEECSGKKKSKFQTFKKFFARKKRKEQSAVGADTGLKASQSSDNVSKTSENNTLTRSEKDKGSGSKISLGSKALSHDSVFVSDSSEANEALGASQDSIHGKVKSLQLQLKQAIKLGSPPSLVCVKRTEDAGTMSEDDGLPCSPPEYTTLHTVMNQAQRNSSISLEGVDSDDDQLSCAASSRAMSPLVVPGDFSQPASPFACLDNSAAKHKLGLRHKACNKRKPASRLEMKTEGDSVVDEMLNTSKTKALEEQEQPDTEVASFDELKPKVEREEEGGGEEVEEEEEAAEEEEEEDNEEEEEEKEKEQPQHSRQSLLRDKEEREEGEDESEAEQDVSHSPDTSSPPETMLSEEEAPDAQPLPSSRPSSRASSMASPRATPEPSAGPREYLLEPPGIAQGAEENEADSKLGAEEDGVQENKEEESSFLQEVLSSLKTPLTSCPPGVETEGVVLELEEEEKEEAEVEDGEEVKEEEAEGDEPVSYQAAPSGSLLLGHATEEEEEVSNHSCQEEVVLTEEEEEEEEEEEAEEEEELAVELFSQHGQKEEAGKEEAEEVKPEEKNDMLTRKTDIQAQEERQEEESEREEEAIELENEPEVEEEEGGEKREEDDLEVEAKEVGVRVEEAEEAIDEEREDDEEMTETFPDAADEEVGTAMSVQEADEGADAAVGDDASCTVMATSDDEIPTELGDRARAKVQEGQENSEVAEEGVEVDRSEQKPDQEDDAEANPPDVDEKVEMSYLDKKQEEKDQTEATEQATVSSKLPSLSLPESHYETQSQESGALSPSKTSTTTIHINLVSPSSEKITSFFQQSPTAADLKEHVTESPDRAVASTDQDRADEEKPLALEEEATPPASVEQTVNQPPSSSDQSKARFTIAPVWQRSQSLTPPSSPPACASSLSSATTGPGSEEAEATTKKDPAVKAEPPSSPKVELVLSPGRARNAGSAAAKPQSSATSSPSSVKPQASGAASTEESSVVVEGSPDNPFGVRLRKTSVLHRFSSEEDNTESPIETPIPPIGCKAEPPQPISVKPTISQPIGNKPALPKKPDVHGDGGGKAKRISDPAVARGVSGGPDSPSWISMAKQKQKIYKENSLDEITVKKEEQERKSSLPMYVSSAASREHSSKTAESPSKVSSLEISKPSASVEKEARRALSPPTPVPPQPSKAQSLPCPVPPKPQVPPASTKPPPQPNPAQRSLSPLSPVPVPQKSPSCTSPPSLSIAATSLPSSQTPQPQSTTATSTPFSSRTAPEKSGSRAPGLSGQTPPSQRGLPPPALPQDEPPWMALAKKKAKAWSEMPQIVQ
ncbi:capping protein inhibiting regulator of actin dynamics isoform X2 [Xiphias gladius]|uniref:capping protein inhibiting regulator of actin dynamics isoform X2 n=1 Tax=Xiphias gladius TaxID=8245 RepID=UPI001A989D98|nr:capping protein inhibiting regulator of actin dynamics isoform X2 [Xiphias gladius]